MASFRWFTLLLGFFPLFAWGSEVNLNSLDISDQLEATQNGGFLLPEGQKILVENEKVWAQKSENFAVPDFEGAKHILFGKVEGPAERSLLLELLRGETDHSQTKILVWEPKSNQFFHHLEYDGEFKKFIRSKRLIIIDAPDVFVGTTWARDTTPITLRDQEGNISQTYFLHHWGGISEKRAEFLSLSRRYENVIEKISSQSVSPKIDFDFLMEGGNFLSNGSGLCLTTTQVLRNNFRFNRRIDDLMMKDDDRKLINYTDEEIEDLNKKFRNNFGCQKLIILEPSPANITGHVDMFAAFADKENIIVQLNSKEPTRREKRNLDQLLKAGLIVHPLYANETETYTNILITTQSVYVPQYHSKNSQTANQAAVQLYTKLFKDKKIMPFDSDIARECGGSIRCRTSPIFVDLKFEKLNEVAKESFCSTNTNMDRPAIENIYRSLQSK